MSLVPKNLNQMKEKLAHQLDSPTPGSFETRALIDQCQQIEKELSQEPIGFLTIDQAAERLGISKQTLRNWEKDGRITCSRTEGGKNHGHRRYREDHINDLRRKQASMTEIILPMVTPKKLRLLGEMLLASFGDDDKINVSVSQGLDNKVKIVIDSEDGLTTMVKTFNAVD